MKSAQIVADLARDEDIDKLLELNRLEYGPGDILATRADFVWRRDQNPAGKAVIVTIRQGGDDIAGCIWVVPMRLRVKGRECSAATATNLLIQPDHRNTFAYTKLMRRFHQVLKDHGISVHFSFVSEQTYRRQRSDMPQTVSTVPLLVKPLDVQSLARTYFTSPWKRALIRSAGWVVSPFMFRSRAGIPNGDIVIEGVDRFDGRFDDFWLKVRDSYPVMAVRDRAFLDWRFASVSGRHYQALIARSGDHMLGYAVLRCLTIRNVKTGLIMDLLVAGGPQGKSAGQSLVAEAETYFRSHGMWVSAGLMSPLVVEDRILRRAGYRALPPAVSPRNFRFAFFIHTAEDAGLVSLSTREWFVTMADYESF